MQPPHRKNVFPPVAKPIEQGCKQNIFQIFMDWRTILEINWIKSITTGQLGKVNLMTYLYDSTMGTPVTLERFIL